MEEKLIREIDPSMVFKVHLGFVSITIKGKLGHTILKIMNKFQ